jgi:ABC-2 type transport system permease protein
MAWRAGPRWLFAYGVICALALVATALAVMLTLALFRTIGARRTRLMAQIVAALIGAAFVIGLQLVAMFSTGSLSRFAALRSSYLLGHAPGLESWLWYPARAALGDGLCLAVVIVASAGLFLAVTMWAAPRFAGCVLAAASVSREGTTRPGVARAFRTQNVAAALRRKEWLLLRRDPWLMSQSLMQLLYLVPPALLLWRSFALGGHAAVIAVPVLIMAAGQIAGGLAWLTISGEDAPDLVLSAPVMERRLLRAKIEAVMGSIALIFAPFALALAFVSPWGALVSATGVAAASWSSILIQLWFRAQAKRSQFRRRHTSSRLATFAEAFSSIAWAATGAIAAAGSPVAVVTAAFALALLFGVRRFAPAGAVLREAGTA